METRKHIVFYDCALRAAERDGAAIPDWARERAVPWETFCHDTAYRKLAVMIDHEEMRSTSRWGAKPRARKYLVRSARDLRVLATAATLERAIDWATRYLETAAYHKPEAYSVAESIVDHFRRRDALRMARRR